MSELKSYKMVDEDYCDNALCVVPSDVYLKSEADEVIRHLKFKRCLKNAESCLYKVWYYDEVHDRNEACRMWKWRERWLDIAKQFKEAE